MGERIALADGRGAAEHKCGHDGGSYLSHEPAPPGPGARRRQGVEALGEGREGGDRLSRLVGFLRRFRLLSGKIGDELRLASRGGGELLLQRFDVSLQRLDVAFEGVREGLVRTACARGAHTLCTCGANGLCARGAHILCVFGDLNARTAVVAAPSRPFPAQGAIPGRPRPCCRAVCRPRGTSTTPRPSPAPPVRPGFAPPERTGLRDYGCRRLKARRLRSEETGKTGKTRVTRLFRRGPPLRLGVMCRPPL